MRREFEAGIRPGIATHLGGADPFGWIAAAAVALVVVASFATYRAAIGQDAAPAAVAPAQVDATVQPPLVAETDAAAIVEKLTAPHRGAVAGEEDPGAPAAFLVDLEPAVPVFETGWRAAPFSPGWQTVNGWFATVTGDGEHAPTAVAFEAHRFVTGLLFVDLFNVDASATSAPHDVELVDLGTVCRVFPGAGHSLTLGPGVSLDITPADKPVYPPSGADANPAGGFYADQVYTGQTGSGRNRFLPAYWSLVGASPAASVTLWKHAYRLVEFQAWRPLQRVDGDGSLSPTAWVDPGKSWARRTLPVGTQQKVIDGYSPNHVAVQELAAVYIAGRDPRSYRQLKALATAFLKHDWYCGESTTPPFVGRGKIPYDNNSRMKGRSLEVCAWAYRCAALAGDTEFATWLRGRAAVHVAAISTLWGSNPTPSRTNADGRHLLEPWDATWCVSLIGWGAALCDSFIGTPGARDLANRVCDWQEAVYQRGFELGHKGIAKDIPATDGDLRRATWFLLWDENPTQEDDRFGLATSQWIVAEFDAVGRASSPLVRSLRSAAVHYNAKFAIVDPSVVLR